jgi:hypothetical protein
MKQKSVDNSPTNRADIFLASITAAARSKIARAYFFDATDAQKKFRLCAMHNAWHTNESGGGGRPPFLLLSECSPATALSL